MPIFLKIGDIKGESRDHKHEGWIEILSINHGLSQPETGAPGTGGGPSPRTCQHEDFRVVKPVDASSPKLAQACCEGTHYSDATLHMVDTRHSGESYLEVRLSNILVSSFGSSSSAEPEPVEEVALNYDKIAWTYTAADRRRTDGSAARFNPGGGSRR